VDFIHISDQWSQAQVEENGTTPLTKPETKKMLIVSYFLPEKVDMDMRPLLQLVIYLVENLKKFKLSRESKNKSFTR
jgi:hypothetical protein